MRISDWSSDVCSSDLGGGSPGDDKWRPRAAAGPPGPGWTEWGCGSRWLPWWILQSEEARSRRSRWPTLLPRSEEHTSELQSLMRISYAVVCLKNKKKPLKQHTCTSMTYLCLSECK